MKLALFVVLLGMAACAAPGDPSMHTPATMGASTALATEVGALDGAPRTIPYGGYVDFDGEPVNAGSVGFNFVLFPCATPGTGAGGCSALWVAKGAWTNTATWTTGWPTGASDDVDLPIFAGRFAVELGGAGQNPLPDEVFAPDDATLYLGVRVEGRALGSLQKLVPTARARVAQHARLADGAGDFTVTGDLDVQGGLTVAGTLLPESLVLPTDTLATLPDPTQHEGEVRYLDDQERLVISDGTDWQPKLGTRNHPALNCQELHDAGETTTASHWITGIADGPAYYAECRNDVHDGGWNLLIRGDLNTSRSPLAWYSHPWWDSFGALGGPGETVYAPGYSGVIRWTQLLVVKTGTAESMILSSAVSASLFSGSHGSLTASQANGIAVSNGAVFTKDQVRQAGNGLVLRRGRWLTGSCDGSECGGTHGFGVAGANHGSDWYSQATTMFQTYSYGTGSPESISIYAR